MENYLINKETMAIVPINDYRSKVYETYITYEIDKKVLDIISYNCLYNGSSFSGRCNSSSFMLGIKYKCPIVVSELKEIIFFPTHSFKKEKCSWLNIDHIMCFYTGKNETIIKFQNNKEISLKVSGNIISNQILKSSRLKTIILNKKMH